jgi:hypothetical protein
MATSRGVKKEEAPSSIVFRLCGGPHERFLFRGPEGMVGRWATPPRSRCSRAHGLTCGTTPTCNTARGQLGWSAMARNHVRATHALAVGNDNQRRGGSFPRVTL